MELPQGPAAKQDRTSIVEFKNGKINFKQKPMSFEKQSETLQEIVSFRGMLEDRIYKQEPPLVTFPDAHKPLIAKLAHESDKTLAMLAKHIHHELLPTLDDEERPASVIAAALPLTAVEDAIKSVLVRNNYGLEAPLGVRLPAALSVWRWEVRSEYLDWLPKNSREKAEARLTDRIQAREDLKMLLEALPKEERDAILDPKKSSNKLPVKETNRPETTPNPEMKVDEAKPTPESSRKQGKKKETEIEQGDTPTAKGKPKKVQDSEKSAKEKEKQEKKAARLEKEKKEKDVHNKSQSLMAKFFSKPKTSISGRKPQVNAVAGPSKIQTDFERVFKPFALGKDKVLAPQNWFQAQKKHARRTTVAQTSNREVIVLESEDESDIVMTEHQPTEKSLESMTSRERLQDSLSKLSVSPSLLPSCRHRNPPGFKIYHSNSVRDFMVQLSEAELSGNDDLVRELLRELNDRETFPAKAFCLHTDRRPGYFGTWTRSSRIIGPRRPLGQDTLVFDYGHDSGEEWEEEAMGEDVVEDGEDEDGDDDDRDSDMESWLVDDDEEIDLAEGTQGTSPPPVFDLPPLPKRKAEDSERKSTKKRKVVIPLMPFAKGPVWESTIGQSDYEPFNPYAIRFFNDTPFPIDPFDFVSSCLEDYKTHQRNVQANNKSEDGIFVVPALPPRLVSSTSSSTSADLSSQTAVVGSAPKRAPMMTKSLFPEAHVTVLLNKINQLQASSITALVEAVYQELREHKIKKIAIETKIKEVGEKCKDTKVWVVKPALMQQIQAS